MALALSLLLIAAGCGDGGATGPQREPDGSGSSDGGTVVSRLAGTWRTVVVVEVPGDLQTWTTTWQFETDGECLQTQEVHSLAEDQTRVTERPCTFTADGFEITINYTGAGTVVFEYAFSLTSPDVLIIDGFEYERVAA